MKKYKEPKAKKLYVAYDIDNPDDLLAFRTPEAAVEETSPEDEQVYAVYEFVGLVKLEKKSRIAVISVVQS